MTNTFIFTPACLGLDSTAMPGYDGEPFTGVNGHFVGTDDFVCPQSFPAFFERHPVYVRNWCSKKLRKCSTHPDVEDWSQTLLTHLCQLPKPRKSVNDKGEEVWVGGTLYQLGFTDVIHAYNPWAHYGASARRFFNFLNLCLSNKFSSLRSRYGKDAATHSAFSLDGTMTSGDSESTPYSREYLLMDRSSLYRESVKENRPLTGNDVFIQQFREYVDRKDPALLPLISAIMEKDKIDEIVTVLGIDQNQFLRDRKKLVKLSKAFVSGRK